MEPYLIESAAQTRLFEATIPWMYLDTYGNVTAAVGKLLSTPEDALKLPFLDNQGNPSTPEAIRADFFRVKAMPTGRPAKSYYSPTAPTLSLEEITTLLEGVIQQNDAILAESFTGYETFPDAAKLGLLDMEYNLGHRGLMYGFRTNFCPAVARKDWITAAAHCHRVGPSQTRNDWTRDKFLEAAKG
jgi:hypothetical protein